MTRRLVALTLVVALISTLTLGPLHAGTAGAAAIHSTHATAVNPASTDYNALSAIPVTGTFSQAHGKQGAFTGIFSIQKFVDQGGKLYAQGNLTGFFSKGTGKSPHVADAGAGNVPATLPSTAVTIPVQAAQGQSAAGQSCPILNLVLGPLSLNLLGLQITLSQVTLNITAIPGAGNLLGNLLCDVVNLLNPSGGTGLQGFLANLLNGLLNLLRPTSLAGPLATLPLSGTVGGSPFAGVLNVTKFISSTNSGQLLAVGQLLGATTTKSVASTAPVSVPISLTSGSGSTGTTGAAVPTSLRTAGARSGVAATMPLATSASCAILHLDLAPTTLNLLGLQINLSRVVLDITAIPGAGNLLGNLLCDITNLLNPGTGTLSESADHAGTLSAGATRAAASSSGTLSDDLTKINALVGSKLTHPLTAIPISGSATHGPDKFIGTMSVQKFVVQNGKVMAQGVLVGVLMKSAGGATPHVSGVAAPGNTAGLVSQAVTAPVVGACQILHLVLGPLSLNLLGLQVNLNQVVLDITAIPGAGNLLGNLLCGVANLLNANSLANLLNNLLSV